MSSSASECPYNQSTTENFIKSCPNSSNLDPSTNLPSENELQSPTAHSPELLPSTRTSSSIPRPATTETWSYPSPRMFYNALLRKGYDTRPEDIQVMVQVHNFLNEQVWAEVLKWETKHRNICGEPKLKRFMGRPHELSPRARFFSLFFGTPRPFDRHDWTIDRCGSDVRYVIDYYSGPQNEEGVFYCDVRPALDSFQAVVDRTEAFGENVFRKIKQFFNKKDL